MLLLIMVGRKLKQRIGMQSNILLFIISCYLLSGISEIVVNTNSLFLPLLYLGWKIKVFNPDNYSKARRCKNQKVAN